MRHAILTVLTLSFLGTAGAIDASSATHIIRHDLDGKRIERKIDKTDAVLTLVESVSATKPLVTGAPRLTTGTLSALSDAGYVRLIDEAYRAPGDTMVFYHPSLNISAFLIRSGTPNTTNVIAIYGQPSINFRYVPLNTAQ